MQGFLSDLFGGGGSKADAEQHGGAEDQADLSPEAGVHIEGGATYTDADGTVHDVEGGQDVTLDTDLGGAFGTDADADESGAGGA